MAHAIRAGGVSIRTSGDEESDRGVVLGYEPKKASRFGNETGLGGLRSYSTLKLVEIKGT
jgi:hypothetical protein